MSTKPIFAVGAAAVAATALITTASPAQAQTAKVWERPRAMKLTIRGDARAATAARAQGLRDYESQIRAANEATILVPTEVLPTETVVASQTPPVYDPTSDPAWWYTPQTYGIPGTTTQLMSAPIQNVAPPIMIGPPTFSGYGYPAFNMGYTGFGGYGVPVGGYPAFGGFGYGAAPNLMIGTPYSGLAGGIRLGF
jgi:hypothetical protein